MLAALATLISSHPARLLGHLQLYGDLMTAETAHAMRGLVRQVTYVVLAVELLVCAVMLAGVAMLLAATVPGVGNHWLLWIVPLVPLCGALVATLKLRSGGPISPFSTLRRQVAADARLLASREAGAASAAPLAATREELS
jgi:FtsH-binding integral membrane protein